eukprot:423690_1
MDEKVIDKAEIKRIRLRNATIKELVETEIQYMNDLKTLTETYIHPLKTNHIINTKQHEILFANIALLMEVNKRFKHNLEIRYTKWDHETSKIANIFLQFAPQFHIYQGYLNSHEQAAGLVAKLYIHSHKFKKFVDTAQFNPKCKCLDLKSYL